MTHVFISYKRDDVTPEFMNELHEQLKLAGLIMWQDTRNISVGASWAEEIDTALRSAYAILVLVSPNSTLSPNMIYEWSYALGRGTKVLPLLLDGGSAQIHPKLNTLEWLSFEKGHRPWIRLVAELDLALREYEIALKEKGSSVGKGLYEEWKITLKSSKRAITGADVLAVVARQRLISNQDYAELLHILLEKNSAY